MESHEARIEPPRRPSGRAHHGAAVAATALGALVAIVVVSLLLLPDEQKGQNVIAIATAAFGVIGAIVGAYFGVSSANHAAELLRDSTRPGGERPPGVS